MLKRIITDKSINVQLFGEMETIHVSNNNFEEIKKLLLEGCVDENRILELSNLGKMIESFSEGNVKIHNGEITYKDEVVDSSMTRRMLELKEHGHDIQPFLKFMNNLYENPSKRSVEELYLFLEASNIPITDDGHFIAYKKIQKDWTDVHSGTFDNSIGKIVTMPRAEVNDNANQTCSAGLHVASYDYMKSFGGDRTVLCKVNPKDVVSVPVDYNSTKMRVCKYEVLDELKAGDKPYDQPLVRLEKFVETSDFVIDTDFQ